MAYQPPPPPPPYPQQPAAPTEESRLFGLIAWILGIIGAVVAIALRGNDPFVKFHAKQSLVLSIGYIAFYVIVIILTRIPVIGMIFSLIGIFMPLIGLLVFIIMILGAIKAYSGEWWRAPIIADIADKINI